MSFQEHFPIWGQLHTEQQRMLLDSLTFQSAAKGTLLHGGHTDSTALFLIRTGQVRAYIFSDEGREITIYRLFDGDMCLFCAPCVVRAIQFAVTIQAEKDTEFWSIPSGVYRKLMAESAAVANYTNELMASRFSEVMWLIEQVMWKSLDKRLAGFLLEEAALEDTPSLKITHEHIANHLGSAREVVTRMLRYFQSENLVHLTRGTVEILDSHRLAQIAQE